MGTVNVRLFAGLRDRAGWSQREIEAATVADVWAQLELGVEPDGLLYAVNKEYAPRDRSLADGDEVALIPPVSGGAFLLSDEPLSLDRVVSEVRSDEAGAIATFAGTTRVHSRGRTVTHLDYEAYEGMAEKTMAEIDIATSEPTARSKPPPITTSAWPKETRPAALALAMTRTRLDGLKNTPREMIAATARTAASRKT